MFSLLCNNAATFSFLDKVFGAAHSPPGRGGVSATSKNNGSVLICRGRGGQLGTPSKASRTDHYYGFALSRSRFAPVCASFVASRHILDGAATLRLRPIGLALRALLCEEGNMTHSSSVQTATASAFGCGHAALSLLCTFPGFLGKSAEGGIHFMGTGHRRDNSSQIRVP